VLPIAGVAALVGNELVDDCFAPGEAVYLVGTYPGYAVSEGIDTLQIELSGGATEAVVASPDLPLQPSCEVFADGIEFTNTAAYPVLAGSTIAILFDADGLPLGVVGYVGAADFVLPGESIGLPAADRATELGPVASVRVETTIHQQDTCDGCVIYHCTPELQACGANADCVYADECARGCSGDSVCLAGCEQSYPAGIADLTALYQCYPNCNEACGVVESE
jgi:hypothetical protein